MQRCLMIHYLNVYAMSSPEKTSIPNSQISVVVLDEAAVPVGFWISPCTAESSDFMWLLQLSFVTREAFRFYGVQVQFSLTNRTHKGRWLLTEKESGSSRHFVQSCNFLRGIMCSMQMYPEVHGSQELPMCSCY